jgi:hypothetical protein
VNAGSPPHPWPSRLEAPRLDQVRIAEDRVEGRLELVTHRHQEVVLGAARVGPVGLLDFLSPLLQLRPSASASRTLSSASVRETCSSRSRSPARVSSADGRCSAPTRPRFPWPDREIVFRLAPRFEIGDTEGAPSGAGSHHSDRNPRIRADVRVPPRGAAAYEGILDH